MNYWFTADTHFGHKNVIRYCNRPFKTLEDMNETIIRKWNERVKAEDTIFHLGDFCFKSFDNSGNPIRAAEWKKRLNGNMILIRGNHDKRSNLGDLKSIVDYLTIKYNGFKILLIHNPERAPEYIKGHNFAFTGHVHEKWKFKRYSNIVCINVGVDVNNFYPKTFEELIREYKKWSKNKTN